MAQVERASGRRRDSPAAHSRGGARPEKTELGLPGADSNGGWVGWHLRCMRKPLVAKSGHGDGWSVELGGGGGSARRGLAGASRPVFSRGYSIPNRAQKVREKVLTLTRGSWWPERLCRVDAGVVVRRRWGGTRGPGGAGLLRAPGPHGSTSGGAAKRTRGSGWPELGRRRGNPVRSQLTVAALGWKSEAGEVRGRGWRPP